MSEDIRHTQPTRDDVARAGRELNAALDDMPFEAQAAVRQRLSEVAAHYLAVGEVDPLIHFVRSLQMTARLHRNPAYRKSVDEAAREPVAAEGHTVEDFMAHMHEQYA